MFPDFMIAGVAKGGTTSLYYYLKEHPEVDIPKKESFFFIRDYYKKQPPGTYPFSRDRSKIIFTDEDYVKLYSDCSKKAIGEVSTCYYLFFREAIPLIKAKLGDIKIILILRNPAERAFSAYRFFKRDGFETLSFEEAITEEKNRKTTGWDFMWQYVEAGFYYESVKAFLHNFTHVKIFLFEDLEARPLVVMKELYRFIGVDDAFAPNVNVQYNISDSQKNNWVFRFFIKSSFARSYLKPIIRSLVPDESRRRAIKHKLRKREPEETMLPQTKAKLIELYRDDILKLQQTLNRDLSRWLQ